jgi:hypothetical protein
MFHTHTDEAYGKGSHEIVTGHVMQLQDVDSNDSVLLYQCYKSVSIQSGLSISTSGKISKHFYCIATLYKDEALWLLDFVPAQVMRLQMQKQNSFPQVRNVAYCNSLKSYTSI